MQDSILKTEEDQTKRTSSIRTRAQWTAPSVCVSRFDQMTSGILFFILLNKKKIKDEY